MSEQNFVEIQVSPILPKAVSDEQVLVFVPIGSNIVAGIFKFNTTDFNIASDGILHINTDDAPTENSNKFVRSGAIFSALQALQVNINKKQDKDINIEGISAKTVEGALLEVKTDAADAKTSAALANTKADETSLLLEGYSNRLVAVENKNIQQDDSIGTLSNRINTVGNTVDALGNRVTLAEQAITANEDAIETLGGDIVELSSKDVELKGLIDTNTQKIEDLESAAYGGETPIGEYPSAATLPSQSDLTNFVVTHTTPSRAPKLGDVVIFTQIVTGGTDKSYKFIYTASEPDHWVSYAIPTIESSSNTDKGLVQGTYAVDAIANTIVDITDGKIVAIYVKTDTGYKNIKAFLEDNLAAAKAASDKVDGVIKKYNNVTFNLVSTNDATIEKFPCKYTANIEGVTTANIADCYFSALQLPKEIFSSYVEVAEGKVSIFATVSTEYPESVVVPTVRIS